MSDSPGQFTALTRDLRSSDEPLWTRLRQLLRERGVEPDSATLVQLFPDDARYLYGVVTVEGGKAFQFGFNYLHGEAEGTLDEWRDCTR